MNENEKIKFCTNCGAKLPVGAKFCGECGEAVEAESKEQEAKSEEAQSTENKAQSEVEEAQSTEAQSEVEEAQSEEAQSIEAQSTEQEAQSEVEEAQSEVEEAQSIEAQSTEQEAQSEVVEAQSTEHKAQSEKEKKVRRGVPVWGCILISLVSVVLSVVITVGVLFFWKLPISKNSVIGSFISNYTSSDETTEETKKQGESTSVDGQTVPAGSDVTINITGDSSNNAAAVYAKCSQSVVGIGVLANTSTSPWKDATMEFTGQGSGVVFTEDGYIITNHHVVEDAIDTNTGGFASGYEVRVYFDQSLSVNYTATLVGYDETADLALLKINATGLTPIEFADSDEVELGDECFAIGSPGGLDFINSISNGIISGIDRNISTDTGYAYDLIQTTTAINPGNSGGALLNKEGKLIGICELKIVSDGYEGMGFAITSNTTKKICESLKENGYYIRPALGLTVNTQYSQTAADEAGLPAGAWVVSVTDGSAADAAGVTANMIITKFNGKSITDYFGLRKELQKCEVGDTIEIEVYDFSNAVDKKSGTYKTLTIKLQILTE